MRRLVFFVIVRSVYQNGAALLQLNLPPQKMGPLQTLTAPHSAISAPGWTAARMMSLAMRCASVPCSRERPEANTGSTSTSSGRVVSEDSSDSAMATEGGAAEKGRAV